MRIYGPCLQDKIEIVANDQTQEHTAYHTPQHDTVPDRSMRRASSQAQTIMQYGMRSHSHILPRRDFNRISRPCWLHACAGSIAYQPGLAVLSPKFVVQNADSCMFNTLTCMPMHSAFPPSQHLNPRSAEQNVSVLETSGPRPIVYGELIQQQQLGDQPRLTVLIYGHYDVQVGSRVQLGFGVVPEVGSLLLTYLSKPFKPAADKGPVSFIFLIHAVCIELACSVAVASPGPELGIKTMKHTLPGLFDSLGAESNTDCTVC